MRHLTNWIEIPVTDMKRANTFYSSILGVELFEMPMGPNQYALFPSRNHFNSGALVKGDLYKPSQDGVTIYLDGGEDLNKILDKVSSAGGTVVLEKTFVGDQAGYVGMFIDTEGNRIGLQNM